MIFHVRLREVISVGMERYNRIPMEIFRPIINMSLIFMTLFITNN